MENTRLWIQEKMVLDEHLRQLQELRILRQELSSQYIERKTEFNQVNENLITELQNVEDGLEVVEDAIRSKSLEIYNSNPEEGKEIYRGIKERDSLHILYDEAEALGWCIDHQLFLKLDKQSFERFMKSLDD